MSPNFKRSVSVPRVCGGCGWGPFCRELVPPLCFATSGCSCVRISLRFLKLWWQIALKLLHECCMGYVLGRKPEHETLCFSVSSGCRRRWKVSRVCGWCGWNRFCRELVPPLCSATSGCSCVHSFMRFLNLWWHVALEWLHDCRHLMLPRA